METRDLSERNLTREWRRRQREAQIAETARKIRAWIVTARDIAVAFAASLLFMVAAWAFLGFVGIASGSSDLCTESFKAATAWAFGISPKGAS